MALSRQKKGEILKSILENFNNAKSVVFSGYQGLSVSKMTALRKQLRQNGAAYKVAKKTLIKMAAKKMNLPEMPDGLLQGSVGLAFGKDEISAAKILHEFGRQNKEVKIFGAFLNGRFLDKNETGFLALIPGKTELLAKFACVLKSPLYGFHAVASGLLRNFMHALCELQKKSAGASQPQIAPSSPSP